MNVCQFFTVQLMVCLLLSCGQDSGSRGQSDADPDRVDTGDGDISSDTNIPNDGLDDLSDNDDIASDSAPDTDFDSETADLDTDLNDTDLNDTDLNDAEDTDPEDVPLGVLSDLEVIESLVNVLAFDVEWSSTIPVPSLLTVDCDVVSFSLGSDELTTSHRAFVTGLVAETDCTVEVSATVDGRSHILSSEFSVAALPDYLPIVPLVVNEAEQREPGWTLMNLNNVESGPLLLAMYDEEGRYRWYYRSTTNGSGGDVTATLVGNRVLFGARNPDRPTLVDVDGTLIWRSEFANAHHEARWIGDGNIYMLMPFCDILEWNTLSDTEVWRWTFADHYEGRDTTADWLHCNSVSITGDGLLLSLRNQNSVLYIDRETGELEWVLGRAGKLSETFEGDFSIDEADQFLLQHDPERLENGNILLFDNGTDERGFSRALELQLEFDGDDLAPESASAVWEYRHEPDIQTPVWGDADRLPNGNTLVTFGVRNANIGSTVVEVNAASEPVWELSFPPGWGVYRSQRIGAVNGYIRSTPAD